MTNEAWEHLSDLLSGWWGQPWTEGKSEAYRLALDRFEPGQVAQALETAGRKDPKWRPGAFELVALIEGARPSQPSLAEQQAMIERAWVNLGGDPEDPAFVADLRGTRLLIEQGD